MVIMNMIIFVKLNWRIMLLISSLHARRHAHVYGVEVQVMLVITLCKITSLNHFF